MDYEALVDGYISTKARAERTASVRDYVFFDDESCSFELTIKGKAMRDALLWVGHEYELTEPGAKERTRIVKAMDRCLDRYPHNPLVAQYWFHWDMKDMHNQTFGVPPPDDELVRQNWEKANKLRSIYDALAPKDKLLSMRYDRDQSNFVLGAYMDIIRAGAYCAAVLGLEHELNSWVAYGQTLDTKDVHGFRQMRLNTVS